MNYLKKILKSIDVAFSIYSKIPMPRFNWASEDMKYHMCFFPWIGAIIGAIEWGWYLLADMFGVNVFLFMMICMAIPLIVTGGFHVDGFMDTMDAVNSYADREKKLEILKDAHIGAFSVISLVTFGLLYAGMLSEISSKKMYICFCLSFFISRAISGIAAMTMKKAKKDGMLNEETKASSSERYFVTLVLSVELFIAFIVLGLVSIFTLLITIIMITLLLIYFFIMSTRKFGGITGDLSGFLLTMTELFCLIAIIAAKLLVR